MLFKKYKKNVKDLGTTSMIAAGSSMAIAGIGGSSTPIQNATRFLPATGTMVGAGHLLSAVGSLDPTRKKKKKKKW